MYYSEENSFNIVKEESCKLVPYPIYLKKRMEQDVMIVMTKDNSIEFLNEVAASFLLSVDGKKTVDEIISLIHINYEVTIEKITIDIIELVRELQLKRIIVLG